MLHCAIFPATCLAILMRTQIARKVVQFKIPCHRHSSQHFCCRRPCKKHKPVLFWATRLATLQQIFQSLRSVTLSLQLVSRRSAASSSEITPSNFLQHMFESTYVRVIPAHCFWASRRDKLQKALRSATCLKSQVLRLVATCVATKLHDKLPIKLPSVTEASTRLHRFSLCNTRI